jgi:hypothetical protein
MPAKDPKMLLELRTPSAATPKRVQDAARMIARALEASDPDLQDGSVTMVVSNLDMRIAVRAQRPAGRRVLRSLSGLISAPLLTVQRNPLMKRAADAIAKESRSLAEMGLEVFAPGRASPIGKIDHDFVNAMEAAARHETPPDSIVRGTSEAYGRVLRIGRRDEGQGLVIRIRVNGEARDISVAGNVSTNVLKLLFDAARDERLVRVEIEVSWMKDVDGNWVVDKRGALVTGAQEFEVASGAEFTDVALSVIEPRSDAELADIISDLETR